MYKSMKLRTAAKLISCIGLIACLIGCAAYCVLCLPEVMNLPFEWLYIIIDLAAMFVFVLVGVLLNLRANVLARRADMQGEEVEYDDENECAAECCATCPLADQCDYLIADDVIPAKKDEAVEEEAVEGEETEACEEATPAVKYPAVVEKVREKLPENIGTKVDQVVVTVQENKKTVVAVAAAAAATVLVIGAGKAQKAKRQAANRRRFYEWLG
ncbi:MAG: hypothetical protein IJW16_07905 [Clostridia bacterium]|nr:hypothetical protein [Clostridia bacterium]